MQNSEKSKISNCRIFKKTEYQEKKCRIAGNIKWKNAEKQDIKKDAE